MPNLDPSIAPLFLSTPVKQGDWTINIFCLNIDGSTGPELTSLSRRVTMWNHQLADVANGTLYDSGRDYDDEDDEDDSDPEDEDDGQDLLSALEETDDEDVVNQDQQDEEEQYELVLTHEIDGGTFREIRQHNLNGHAHDEVPGADVVITINYSSYPDQHDTKKIVVFQHLFIGHLRTSLDLGDFRNGTSSTTRQNLAVTSVLDVFRHELYADPETVQTTIASWVQEQHNESSH